MHKPFIFLFLLLAYGGISQGQDTVYARKIVNKLTSPEFYGRGYIRHGEQKAAHYILKEFKKLGLQPMEQGYEQPFAFNVNTFRQKQRLEINGIRMKPGVDFLVNPTSGSFKGRFRLPPQEQGKTMIAYALPGPKEVQGKMKFAVLKDKGMPEQIVLVNTDGTEAGVIRLNRGKLTWSISQGREKEVKVDLSYKDSIFQINTISIDIRSRLEEVVESNIIGCIPGTEKPDSIIMLVAHYDHLGMMGPDALFPGANDNASGVALMLNLTRYYSEHPPRYTLVCMAAAAEEAGILGSIYFCKNPLFELSKIRFLLNLDLAGTGNEGIMVVNASVYKREFALLKSLNSSGGYMKDVKPRGEACNSDHCAFYSKGVPCFFIYTLGGISAYHDLYDRAETLPLDGFSNYCKLLVDFTRSLQVMPK
jgi:aminopeptidase YwaD